MYRIKKLTIISGFIVVMLFNTAVGAVHIPEPYRFDIYFDSFSATPETDIIMKLGDIRDEIIKKQPVKIEITGYSDVGEEVDLARKRAEYVLRWMKSTTINAHFIIHPSDEKAPKADLKDGRSCRRVNIAVYDQRMIYARQDAERHARKKKRKLPRVHIPAIVHSFGTVLEGTPVDYSFNIRNIGDAVLEILKVKPD